MQGYDINTMSEYPDKLDYEKVININNNYIPDEMN